MNQTDQEKHSLALNFALILVSSCLTLYTLLGAHSLTGTWLLAIALAAVVPLQWKVAQTAFERFLKKSYVAGLILLLLWLGMAAGVTVPLTGAELFGLFAAKTQSIQRAQTVLAGVHKDVAGLAVQYEQLAVALDATVFHAQEKAKDEIKTGGTCGSFGSGPGNIERFRRAEADWAQSLRKQVSPALTATRTAAGVISNIRYDGSQPVATLHQALVTSVGEVNSHRANPMWAQVSKSVEDRVAAGHSIPMPNRSAPVDCDDKARDQLLSQLQTVANNIANSSAIGTEFGLLDSANHKDIALATMARTWSTVTSVLPGFLQLHLGKDMEKRYGIDTTKPFELTDGSMPLALAWVLELIVLALTFFNRQNEAENGRSDIAKRVKSALLSKATERFSWLKSWLDAIKPTEGSTHTSNEEPKEPFRAAWATKAEGLLKDCLHSYGRHNWLIVCHGTQKGHNHVAQALSDGGHLKRIATSLTKAEVSADQRFKSLLEVRQSNWSNLLGPFAVYRIDDPSMLKWAHSRLVQATGL